MKDQNCFNNLRDLSWHVLVLHDLSWYAMKYATREKCFNNLQFFSSASSRLGSYYGLSFLEHRLFWLFMIHMILTTHRDISWTWFGFLHGFNTGLGTVNPCIHSISSWNPILPDWGANSRPSSSKPNALPIAPQRPFTFHPDYEHRDMIFFHV